MSYQIALKKKCSRCPRVESEDVTIEEALHRTEKKEPTAAIVELDGGQVYAFDALCAPCRAIVISYLEKAFAVLDKPSFQRTREDGEPDIAVEPA